MVAPKVYGTIDEMGRTWENFVRRHCVRERKVSHTREYNRAHRAQNSEHYQERERKRRLRIRDEMLKAYGGKCVNCGIENRDLLDLDHIYDDSHLDKLPAGNRRVAGNMAAFLKKVGYPKDRYQLLCKNCNWLKELERRRRCGPPIDLEDLGLL